QVLWIGCADSRCPESMICGYSMGDVFSHRKEAKSVVSNIVKSIQAVIQYAINNLHIEDIVLAGHTKCGGVEAAWLLSPDFPPSPILDDVPTGSPLWRWLQPLITLPKKLNLNRLPWSAQKDTALRLLTDAHAQQSCISRFRGVVTERVLLSKSKIVQEARLRGKRVDLHAWVFEIETGNLVDVGHKAPGSLAPKL
ncbi:carbonic anhydrase, partial [Mycena leptocephala]